MSWVKMELAGEEHKARDKKEFGSIKRLPYVFYDHKRHPDNNSVTDGHQKLNEC